MTSLSIATEMVLVCGSPFFPNSLCRALSKEGVIEEDRDVHGGGGSLDNKI